MPCGVLGFLSPGPLSARRSRPAGGPVKLGSPHQKSRGPIREAESKGYGIPCQKVFLLVDVGAVVL
jgi:hypothetical protein